MKIIGIVAEYNPFHLGHLYQINKVKELYPDSLIVVIISTNFTERGDISLLTKWDKARICLAYGIDLVVELPTLYAVQSADIFAKGALKILNELKIDTLVFGSECDDVDTLIELANTQINNLEYDKLVKAYLDEGINYPTATSKALLKLINKKIDKPNDLLALSYIKEIIKNDYPITPVSIKRTNDYHGIKIDNDIISANLIRKLISEDKDVSKYVPKLTLKYLNKGINLDKAYNYLRYNIINNKDSLDEYLMIDEGIENRILKYITTSSSWHELVMNVKTKRYTYNKINRILICILLGIKKIDNTDDIYVRLLGFNDNGRKYLNMIKKEIKSPVFTNYKEKKSSALDIEYNSTFIYSLITNNDVLIQYEKTNKPIIK